MGPPAEFCACRRCSRCRHSTFAHPLCTAACPAVFVSGGGSNFRAIHAAIQEGSVHGEVAVVVSNAPTCGGVAYAQSHGIPTLTYPAPKSDPSAGLTAEQLVQQLTQAGAAPRLPLLPWAAAVGGAHLALRPSAR